MSIRARVPAISRDIELMIADTLSPGAQSKFLADFAREKLEEAQSENRAALGRVPDHQTFVDGQRRDDLESVRPNGVIAFEFELLEQLLAWIGEQLVLHSPVLTGKYANSHVVFVDGVEAAPGAVPVDGEEWAFINTVPYARKIERGLSPQAPDGVYEAVAAIASRRFGNLARIRYTFRSITGGGKDKSDRQPAIVVRL